MYRCLISRQNYREDYKSRSVCYRKGLNMVPSEIWCFWGKMFLFPLFLCGRDGAYGSVYYCVMCVPMSGACVCPCVHPPIHSSVNIYWIPTMPRLWYKLMNKVGKVSALIPVRGDRQLTQQTRKQTYLRKWYVLWWKTGLKVSAGMDIIYDMVRESSLKWLLTRHLKDGMKPGMGKSGVSVQCRDKLEMSEEQTEAHVAGV